MGEFLAHEQGIRNYSMIPSVMSPTRAAINFRRPVCACFLTSDCDPVFGRPGRKGLNGRLSGLNLHFFQSFSFSLQLPHILNICLGNVSRKGAYILTRWYVCDKLKGRKHKCLEWK